jgi:hypothetical protein
MVKQTSTDEDTIVHKDDDIESEWWLKDIKHRMECSQCEHAYYVHSEGTWYCIRKHKLTEGHCEYE